MSDCVPLFAAAIHHARKGGSGQQTISQDQVFQLLTTAVYNGPEDPERRSSLEQLSSMVSRLQEPPGPANDVAIFSTRQAQEYDC